MHRSKDTVEVEWSHVTRENIGVALCSYVGIIRMTVGQCSFVMSRRCMWSYLRLERAGTAGQVFERTTHMPGYGTGKLSTRLNRQGPLACFPWKFISLGALSWVYVRGRVRIAFAQRERDLDPTRGLKGIAWVVLTPLVGTNRVFGFPLQGC